MKYRRLYLTISEYLKNNFNLSEQGIENKHKFQGSNRRHLFSSFTRTTIIHFAVQAQIIFNCEISDDNYSTYTL